MRVIGSDDADINFTVFPEITQCKTTLNTTDGIKVVEIIFNAGLVLRSVYGIRLRQLRRLPAWEREQFPALPVLSA